MTYKELREHVGHKVVLNDVTDWGSNLETGIELRCEDCEACEPLLEMDNPVVEHDEEGNYKLKL